MSSSQKEPMIVRWKDNIVEIGAGRPVVIQSMTNTDTADVESSTKQVLELAQAGSELVRLTVNTPAAAKAIPEIRRRLDETGCFVPLVGDFHYNGHKLLTEYRECAEALSKYRINPGNVGKGDKQEENFRTMVELAKKYDKPVRIGVNWGSLDQDLLACMMSENQKLEKPLDAKEVLREALVRSRWDLVVPKSANGMYKVTIGAEGGECWFGVYQDKKLVHNAQLKSGETRDYEVPYPFKVSVGNRAKGFVKVDGAPVDLNINNRATSTVFTLVQK